MAETLEGTKSIDTLTITAHLALEGAALIYVCKVKTLRRLGIFLKVPHIQNK